MMKFLNINATINVKPQFSGEVLKAGTPLDISGAIANSDAAVGLVANDTAKGAESIAIVTEGSIDLAEVAASYGEALTDDCIAALKGITFLYGGKAGVPSGGGGGMLVLERTSTGAISGATAAEIRAAVAAGTPLYIKWGDAMRPAVYTQGTPIGNIVEAVFTTLQQDPDTGDFIASVSRWYFAVNTSSLGTLYSQNQRLALYSDLPLDDGSEMAEG